MASKSVVIPIYLGVTVVAMLITLIVVVEGQDTTEVAPVDLSKYRCRNANCSGKRVKICQQATSESTSILFVDQVNGDNKCQCCFEKTLSRRKLRRIWAKARKNVSKSSSSPAAGDETTIKPEFSTFAELPTLPSVDLPGISP